MVVVLKKTNFGYLSRQAGRFAKLGILFVGVGAIMLMVEPIIGLVLIAASTVPWNRWLSYMKGIQGEKRTSRTLRNLDDDYFLLDDVQLYPTSGNIDHILLGPNGIIAIESKNYSGIVSCNGDTWYRSSEVGRKGFQISSISMQAKGNAKRLYKFLQRHLPSNFGRRPFIVPLIVFTNSSMELRSQNAAVEMTYLKNLCRIIEDRWTDQILSESDLRIIGDAILSNLATEHEIG